MLSIQGFNKLEKGTTGLKLENLKEYMLSLKYEKSVRLLCLSECQSCDILVDGEKKETLDNFLDKSVKVYRYEFFQGLHEREKQLYFNTEDVEENVCFSYAIDKQGVGDQVLVEYKKAVYDFTAYLTSTLKYSSLSEAINERENRIQELQR